MDLLSGQYGAKKLELDQAVTAQMNANREEKLAREQLFNLQQEFNNTESDLRRLTSRVSAATLRCGSWMLEAM